MSKEIKNWVLLFPESKGQYNRQDTAKTVIQFLLNARPGEVLNTGDLMDTGHFSIGGIIIERGSLNKPIMTYSVKRIRIEDGGKIRVTTKDGEEGFFITWKDRSPEMRRMVEDIAVVNLPPDGYVPNYLKGFGFI